jgi:hypothetical protein
MKTSTSLQLELAVLDASLIVSSDDLIEPGSNIARLTANLRFKNESNEIQGVSCNATDLQLFDAEGQEVFLLTDDRNRDAADAMPLQPKESAEFKIECGLSATRPDVGKPYVLRATYGAAVGEARFTFEDATAKPR